MKLKIFIFTIVSFCFLNFSAVNAGEVTTDLRGSVNDISNTDGSPFFKENLGSYINQFLEVILIIGALACLMYLLLGGLNWVTSSGDKQKVEDARNKITNAIIGLAILAATFALWKLAISFFGIDKTDLLKVK